jgi:hypothetical protein
MQTKRTETEMNENRQLRLQTLATVVVVLAGIAVMAGQSLMQNGAALTDKPSAPKNKTVYPVFVIVRGPWAFVRDDINKQLILVTVDVPGHPSAYIRSQKPGPDLTFGVYQVSLPAGTTGVPMSPQDIVNFSAKSAQLAKITAIPSKLKRYVVSLPMPDDIGENLVDKARVGGVPHPATSEQDYTTEMILSYSLTSLSAFSVTGKDNSGKPITPVSITPSKIMYVGVASDFIGDPCDNHAKKAFNDLTTLFSNPLYVDYPPYDSTCPPLEDQSPNGAPAVVEKKADVRTTSPEEIQRKLNELRAYLTKTVDQEDVRRRLLSDSDVMSKYLELENAKKPPHPETRKALDAAMDVRRYLKNSTGSDPQRDQMLDNLGAILVHIFNTGGKNCKAPMALVTIQ